MQKAVTNYTGDDSEEESKKTKKFYDTYGNCLSSWTYSA